MAKMFEGVKPMWRIRRQCQKNGWPFNQEKYNAGSDWVTFGFVFGKKKVEVVFSSFNGRFIVKHGKKMITESSTEMDGTPWYDALLSFIYIEKKEPKAA